MKSHVVINLLTNRLFQYFLGPRYDDEDDSDEEEEEDDDEDLDDDLTPDG